ncbi:ATP synthase [Lithospermum erythrorhizon]|uniref:ATP synthase n=1 Tax=Lithospermum erythrorhizon TaxID=34254 RepID=A0AAV3NJ37_LITER
MVSQERLPPTNSNTNASMQRVKVYRLNGEGKWDDQGTGHVTVDYLERSEELGLYVIDEDDNETLLLHRISSEDIYRKQEDTIISWRDPEFSTELALSFQETTGCSYIWDHICSVQRSMQFNSLSNDAYHNVNRELRELPPVDLSTLHLIHKTIVDSGISDQMRVAELILHDQVFLRKLMDLFSICEDLSNRDGLHMICKIVRGIILLNSPPIFERIFGDELIMDVIGCLEYDPDLSQSHHRDFLKEHVVFKEAIPIKDPLVLSKIHQTYRIGYLKDVVLSRVLDDATIANLNSIIHSNNAIVVSLLKDDSTFIQELFAKLKSSNTSTESKKNLVRFLQEFCALSKSLQMVQQLRLFRDLVSEGVFDILRDVLHSEDKKLVLTGTDILILFLNQDANLLRSYVARPEGASLFGLLVKGMLTDFENDMHCQFLEIIRSLLDSYTTGAQRDAIVEIFYEKHLGQLIDGIILSCPPIIIGHSVGKDASPSRSRNHGSLKPEILLNICDLLCFCVVHHPYRIKSNFLLNNVIGKVLNLTRRRENYLVAAAVRFVRTLISRNDEHLLNHLAKQNLLKPIVDVFIANGSRYNLLNSSVLELFEFIRKENLKILLKHLVETFWNELVEFENFPSIRSLKVKYEQSLESSELQNASAEIDTRKRVDERALEKEEEDYFNEDSDEEDSASAAANAIRTISRPVANGTTAGIHSSGRTGGLVDYDEDDEDFKPPPRKKSEVADEDEGIVESLGLKRKLSAKDEPKPKRLQKLPKRSKPNCSLVFSPLSSAQSNAASACKKNGSASHTTNSSEAKEHAEANDEQKAISSSDQTRTAEADSFDQESSPKTSPKSSSDDLSKADSRPLEDDHPLIPPKPSAEMAVNGS